MRHLFILILFMGLFVISNHAQPNHPQITPDNVDQLHEQYVFSGFMPNTTILFSPDDNLILADGDPLYLWDTSTGERIYTLMNGGNSISIKFSPNTHYLMTITDKGKINIWDLSKGDLLYSIDYDDENNITNNWRYHQNPNFSPNVQTFFTTLWNTLHLRDIQTGALIQAHTIPDTQFIEQAIFSPDGRHIITISQGNHWWSRTIHWWDISTWTADVTISDTRAAIISPDGQYVAYGIDNEIYLFDTQTGETHLFNSSYRATITYLRFSKDGEYLFSGTEGEISKWWDVETGEFITTNNYIGTKTHLLDLNLCEEDDILRYCIIDVTTQEAIFTLRGHVGNIRYAQFNYAGTQIVTRGVDGTIRLWGVGED